MRLSCFQFTFGGSEPEILVTSGLHDMLGADMKALIHDAITNLLCDLDADGCARNIENATGASLVEFVGHSLENCGVYTNVNEVADLVDLQIR